MTAAGVVWLNQYNDGRAPESMRDELAGDIVTRWSVEGARSQNVTPAQWEQQISSTLQSADMSNLERAASSTSYDGMSAALLGNPTVMAAGGDVGTMALGSTDADLVYTPITTCRIADSRIVGGPIATNGYRDLLGTTATDFTAQGGSGTDCGIPANVAALSMRVTAVNQVNYGYFTLYPADEGKPLISSLNFTTGRPVSNHGIVRLCRPGCASQIKAYANTQADIVIDVDGYFTEPEATALDCTVAQQTGNLDLLSGLQTRSVSCPAGYTATGGGCGGPLGIGISDSQPLVTSGQPTGWSCGLVGSLLSVISYEVNATCCRTPGR
ncbi:hypothetical protein [Marilutibacter maris]|uniref:Uncharacterized protein n=1 Tax=Marilutibacter maris TaxID=1605891 RepID=A0A508ASJ5_9GAMM|nr:hypothetical protein [Lysobacter maris]KAB8181082.1 hypothetical protein FKV24_011890 [Lysobacter maris]